jgi:hypothetical protein
MKRAVFFIYEESTSSWCLSSKQAKFDEFIDAVIFSSVINARKALKLIKEQVKTRQLVVRGKLMTIPRPSFRVVQLVLDATGGVQ